MLSLSYLVLAACFLLLFGSEKMEVSGLPFKKSDFRLPGVISTSGYTPADQDTPRKSATRPTASPSHHSTNSHQSDDISSNPGQPGPVPYMSNAAKRGYNTGSFKGAAEHLTPKEIELLLLDVEALNFSKAGSIHVVGTPAWKLQLAMAVEEVVEEKVTEEALPKEEKVFSKQERVLPKRENLMLKNENIKPKDEGITSKHKTVEPKNHKKEEKKLLLNISPPIEHPLVKDSPDRDYMPPGFFEFARSAARGGPGALHELEMCTARRAGPQSRRDSWPNGCEDPTCSECIPEQDLQDAAKMQLACFAHDSRAKRRQFLLKKLGQPRATPGPVVLTAVTQDSLPLILNWACGRLWEGLGEPFKDTVLVARDQQTYDSLVDAGFEVVLNPSVHFGNLPEEKSDKKECASLLFCILHQMSEMGYDVLLHDAGLVWMKDPRKLLASEFPWNQLDITGAPVELGERNGPLYSGFAHFRSTRKTRSYLRSMLALTPLLHWMSNDQVIYNTLLRHWRYRQLFFQLLPQDTMTNVMRQRNGMVVSGMSATESPYVFRTLTHQKETPDIKALHLREAGLWYVQSECFISDDIEEDATDEESSEKNGKCKHLADFCIAPSKSRSNSTLVT